MVRFLCSMVPSNSYYCQCALNYCNTIILICTGIGTTLGTQESMCQTMVTPDFLLHQLIDLSTPPATCNIPDHSQHVLSSFLTRIDQSLWLCIVSPRFTLPLDNSEKRNKDWLQWSAWNHSHFSLLWMTYTSVNRHVKSIGEIIQWKYLIILHIIERI